MFPTQASQPTQRQPGAPAQRPLQRPNEESVLRRTPHPGAAHALGRELPLPAGWRAWPTAANHA